MVIINSENIQVQDFLYKKIELLKKIININNNFSIVAKQDQIDYDKLSNIMNEKQTYIDELERLDDLFKTIIHNTSFSQEIKQIIKDGCNEISDLTNRLKLQENGNKKSIEMQLNNSKKQIRNYNNSKNRTSQYNNYNIDAYFLDEKK